jgi:hypothetical protein
MFSTEPDLLIARLPLASAINNTGVGSKTPSVEPNSPYEFI